MRSTTIRHGVSRLTHSLAEAWDDCRYASRRLVELQVGPIQR
jgi:hypothetical protein